MDKERIYAKMDEMEQYLKEIHEVVPDSLEDYRDSIEKKRATERLLQITIGAVMDICSTAKASKVFDKRIKYSVTEGLDVQIFQDLPLYIRKRVLKEGKVLHCKDEDLLYDIAIKTAKEFELFRPKYEIYLEGVAKG